MKKILLIILIFATATLAKAQNDTNRYFTSKAGENWFVSIGGGANLYFGEFDKHGSLGKRIASAAAISAGKWITPSVGLRANFEVAKMRGFINPASTKLSFIEYGLNHYYGTADNEGYYKEKFNYMNVHADALFSLFKYRENRLFQMIPYVGLGYAWRFKSHESGIHEGYFTANAGLINRFRISRIVDIDFEIGSMFVNQKFDGQYRESMLDAGLTAMIGVNVKLGGRKFHKPQVVKCDYAPYEKRIADNENNFNKKIKKLNDELDATKRKLSDCEQKLNDKPKPIIVEKPTVEETTMLKKSFQSIYFETNSSVLKNESKRVLDDAAEILRKYPNAKITLSGYTDSQGSAEYNKRLSQRRAEAVKTYLQQHGVTTSISANGYGEENPIDSNATATGRAKNRRTEIEIF